MWTFGFSGLDVYTTSLYRLTVNTFLYDDAMITLTKEKTTKGHLAWCVIVKKTLHKLALWQNITYGPHQGFFWEIYRQKATQNPHMWFDMKEINK
jgi:hypothetical protein